ncbi:MAG: hypothetical protein R2991_11445 [Thermoanaerobaculia bacterium]
MLPVPRRLLDPRHRVPGGRGAGRPVATAEAIPHWTPVADIPYDEMWEDDRIWLPHLLDGVPFSGRFVFDDDRLLDWTLDPVRR